MIIVVVEIIFKISFLLCKQKIPINNGFSNAKKILMGLLKANKGKEEDIEFEQDELNNYQLKRFGPQGDWLAQKVVFTQPIQDKILEAVKEIAENRKLDYVFDRSAEILVFHSEKKYDISNLVVKYINQKDKKKAREELVESRKQEQNAARQKAIEKRKKEMDSIRKAKSSQQQKN